MICVNLYGAPGVGKSTSAAYLFYALKSYGFNCELVTEVAKDYCWEENNVALRNQLLIAGQQQFRLDRLKDKVDIVITDSPLMLQTIYYKLNDCPREGLFNELIYAYYNEYDNLDFFLPIIEKAKDEGRIHLEQSGQIQNEIINMFNEYKINAEKIDYRKLDKVLDKIILHYRNLKKRE